MLHLSEQQLHQLQSDILKSLRGSKSQKQMNHMLRQTSNSYARWENLYSFIKWDVFAQLCDQLNINLKFVLYRIFAFGEDYRKPSDLIAFFKGQKSISEFATINDVSRNTVAKWLENKSSPSLVQVLSMMNQQNELMQFLNSILDIKQLNVGSPYASRQNLLRQLMSDNPLISILLLLIESMEGQGKYQRGILTHHLDDVDQSLEDQMLDLLINNKFVDEDIYGYSLTMKLDLNLGSNNRKGYTESLRIREHWHRHALSLLKEKIDLYSGVIQRQHHAINKERFYTEELMVSEEAEAQIDQEVSSFFHRIREICQQDLGPKTKLKVLNISLLRLLEVGQETNCIKKYNIDLGQSYNSIL